MNDDRYTHGHHDAVLRSHRSRTAANSAQYLIGALNSGDRLLDVGCGPGTLTADLAQSVAPGRVVGMDREPAVLEDAAAVCATRDVGNVEFVAGDVYEMEFPDGSFEVVHAHQVLQHLSDPVAALVEMRRVATPGGLVAVRDSDYGAMTWYPADPRLVLWRDLYTAVARSNSAEPDAGRRLLSWAKQAGFDEVVPSSSVWCFADADSRSWWGELWAERMTDSAVGEQARREGLAADADLESIAAGFREWAAADDGWFVVVHGEVLARA